MGRKAKLAAVTLAGSSRQTTGRYASVNTAIVPGELPREGRDNKLHIVHAALDDPNPMAGDIQPGRKDKRQRVAVNARHDALEWEHATGRLSAAAYAAGRTYQLIRERAGGNASGGGQWAQGDRVDQAIAIDAGIWRRIQNANECMAMVREVLPVIGQNGEAVLVLTLGHDRLRISQAAMRLSGGDDRYAVSFWAETFRRSCEQLADLWSAKASDR